MRAFRLSSWWKVTPCIAKQAAHTASAQMQSHKLRDFLLMIYRLIGLELEIHESTLWTGVGQYHKQHEAVYAGSAERKRTPVYGQMPLLVLSPPSPDVVDDDEG